MMDKARFGMVIFAADPARLADFYAAATGLPVRFADETIVVLASATCELVIHRLPGAPAAEASPAPRQDSYIKPFFPVASLASTRETVARLGGSLDSAEWSGRGFRACEAVDPEGNVIQFREDAR